MFRNYGYQSRSFLFSPDDGAGSGVQPTAVFTATTATPAATIEQGKAPAAAIKAETPETIPYSRFHEVNESLKELKKWKTERETADKAAAKTAEEAEKKRLAEQGNYQKLAEDAERRAKEFEPFKTKAERAEAALTKLLEAERKGLPKHVTTLLDKLDIVDQLDWIAENRAELQKPTPPNVNATGGQGNTEAPGSIDQTALWKRLGFNNALKASEQAKR